MKISIVTPSWNQGRFLRRCLESIRPAPGLEVEHIVLDNCSNDETSALLAEFATRDDGVTRRFIIEKDDGQTRAINDGFRMATGDVVCWLNTDEWYADRALEKVAQHFAASPNTDFLYGNCDFVGSKGQTVQHRRSLGFRPDMLLYYGCFISSAAAFVRRRAVDEGELLDPQYRVAMDYEWYVRLAARGYRFAHIVDTLAFFTWHADNISKTFYKRSVEEGLMIQRAYGESSIPLLMQPAVSKARRTLWKGRRTVERLTRRRASDAHGPRTWLR